jgi:hypothetical protein
MPSFSVTILLGPAQGRSVYVNRVSPANTSKKRKINSILPYFLGLLVLHTLEHIRNDKIKCIVSQLQPARRCYARRERKSELAG